MRRYILVAIVSLLSALGLAWLNTQPADTAATAQRLEKKIRETETEIIEQLSNHGWIDNALREGIGREELKQYAEKPYYYLFYRHNPFSGNTELRTWTNNTILPPANDIHYDSVKTVTLLRVKESYFEMIKMPFEHDGDNYSIVGLIPLRVKYPIGNDYLQETFPLIPSISADVTMAPFIINSTAIIHDATGKELIGLRNKDMPNSNPYWFWRLLLLIIGFSASILVIDGVALILNRRKSEWLAMAFIAIVGFTCIFSGMRLIASPFYSDLYWTEKFAYGKSVFNFLPWVFTAFWMAVFFYKNWRVKWLTAKRPVWVQYLIAIGAYAIIIVGFLGLTLTIEWAIRHRSSEFNIGRLPSINLETLLYLIGLVTGILGYFLASNKLLTLVSQRLKLSYPIKAAIVLPLLLVLRLSDIFSEAHLNQYSNVLLLFALLYVVILELFIRDNKQTPAWILSWLVFFGAYSATFAYQFNKDRDIAYRKNFAGYLASEHDPRFEAEFYQLRTRLLADKFIEDYLATPINSRTQLEDRIEAQYLDELFFNRYDYAIHTYSRNNIPLSGESLAFEEWLPYLEHSVQVYEGALYRYSNPEGTYLYFARVPYGDKGTLMMRFEPKPLLKSNVYNTLLSPTNAQPDERIRSLEFAIYKNSCLEYSEGGDFPTTINPALSPTEEESFYATTLGNIDYITYKTDNEDIAVVGKIADDILRPFSVFSYMFCFMLLYLGVVYGIARGFETLTTPVALRKSNSFSLRGRIQVAVIALIVTAFIIIAAVTVLFNRRELSEYHRTQLERKVAAAAAAANERIALTPNVLFNTDETAHLVASIAQTQDLVVNVYNLNGELMASSTEILFDRKILSRQINPLAFYALTHDRENLIILTEKIGSFEYQTAYAPLKSDVGTAVGYLNIPYDAADDRSGKRDVAALLGALLNVYVLLLLFAGILAIAVANSVTRPLAAIADKLRQVKLGIQSERVDYQNDDEIGLLVRRYNDMVEALEQSTIELAKSQKESAWREMAKQVAHEIKNPLTPMKLNLQLLERAFESDPERAKEMYKRISSSLIEQIDGLAHIASEFSNFAKMPTAKNERFLVNKLVESVCELFEEEGKCKVALSIPEKAIYVMADKNQLMRVLNNLVKNAIQAIPEGREGEISVSVIAENAKVIISVQDNGIGIPEDQRLQVFVPHFTTKTSGSGLGLAMSKQIVEAAEGRIWFETEIYRGTTFFVELPMIA